MDLKLLKKFCENKCTSSEIDEVFVWILNHPDQISGENLLSHFWADIPDTGSPDEDYARRRLDSIHHKINLNEAEQKAKRKIPDPLRRRSLLPWISRAAAILLVPVIILFVYTRLFQTGFSGTTGPSTLNEIISPAGSRTFLILADGTKVWLNHGSKMVYPQWFTGKTRTVWLDGEGYFEVAHDPSIPFIVESGEMVVKAVGTEFNVRAYNDDPDFETTLKSGKVIIQRKNESRELTICNMSPGQHLVFDNTTNTFSLQTGELSKYTSWKDGKLIFKDDTMDKVAERLSRWYNVKVIIQDPEINEITCTATFIDESLSQVLEMMEIVAPISFTVSQRQKMTDGTYSQKEISIYKKTN